MTEGHHRDTWQHTASLMALVANVNRDPKKTRPFKPSDFNPYVKKTSRPDVIVVTKENVSLLKQAFLKGKFNEK
jgi:mitochondrial fission protein ELM1